MKGIGGEYVVRRECVARIWGRESGYIRALSLTVVMFLSVRMVRYASFWYVDEICE